MVWPISKIGYFLKLALQLRQSTGEKSALINEAFEKCVRILQNPL